MLRNMFRGLVELPAGLKSVFGEVRKLGVKGCMRALYEDLFTNRSLFGWVYLILLSSIPIVLELTSGNAETDWVGLFASLTGIICVILVSEGRLSNYLFGTLNSAVYLYMALDATFYGEVVTTVYFFIMQPIGWYLWMRNKFENKDVVAETQENLVVKRLDLFGWVKFLALTALIWFGIGTAYKGIGSARPFRDSVTDGTNYVGQLLMNGVYQEQWLFWIATNLFSIYLWWGANVHIQGMYWVYLINSIVGWYNWYKQVRKAN